MSSPRNNDEPPATGKSGGLSRRSFIGVGAVAAITAGASLVGCARQTVDTDASEADGGTTGSSKAANDTYTPSFLEIPNTIPDSSIKDTVECSVVIVGAGLSGLCAARALAENSTGDIIVIEKAESYQYRSTRISTIGGAVQDKAGSSVGKHAAVEEIMKTCGYRPNQRLLNQWADFSGEALNWFLAPCEGTYAIEDENAPYDGISLSARLLHWPHGENSEAADASSPTFDATQALLPDLGPYLERTYQICVERKVEFWFSTFARQLVRESSDDRVEGVIVEDLEGNYLKINASKAVLLASGDYSSNAEMLGYYDPWATRFTSSFENLDAKGEKTNTGDGQRMGMWIGAKMEAGPHAPMLLNYGGPLGIDSFLLVDRSGNRFTNEDIGAQYIQNQLSRLPGKIAWQIFDAKWTEQLGNMSPSHGSVNWYVADPNAVPNGDYGKNAYISSETNSDGNTPGFNTYFAEDTDNEANGVVANTLEELAEKMGVEPTVLVSTIARYNQLAGEQNDADFGKRASRMFAIADPPFYAYKFTDTTLAVNFGGLVTNTKCQVLDTSDEIIPGLYAVGNAQGARILVDYPASLSGISHGMALTHGMLVGRELASQ